MLSASNAGYAAWSRVTISKGVSVDVAWIKDSLVRVVRESGGRSGVGVDVVAVVWRWLWGLCRVKPRLENARDGGADRVICPVECPDRG